MDNLKKIASGFCRSGVLTTGLFGLYYFHKKQIPGYMGFISFCVACMGLYAMSTFILEDEYEKPEEDKDEVPKPMRSRCASGTPTPKMKPIRTRRILARDELLKETDKMIENLCDAKKRKLKAEISPKEPTISKIKSEDKKMKLENAALKFEEPNIIKNPVSEQISPAEVKMPDIIDQASTTESSAETSVSLKDIIGELQAKSASIQRSLENLE